MAPLAQYSESGAGPLSYTGLLYVCPACDTRVNIRDTGSIITGSLFALACAAIGWWAFRQGPLWYLTNFSYFTDGDYNFSFAILDLLAFAFYTIVCLFALWFLWTQMIKPLKLLIQNPETYENRPRTETEIDRDRGKRYRGIASFFLFPILIYVPLFAGIWLLDALGFDVRQNELLKFAGIALIFGIGILLARRFQVSFGLVFFGLVFWMALFVGAVFTLR